MTTVIAVPPSLDDATFEQLLDQLASVPPDRKVIIDARHARWASPYGLTGRLTLAQTREERPAFTVPEPGDPTGCGDGWGATYFSRLLAGDKLSDAMRTAAVAAARNVGHRGATGLANYLRGELSLT